MKEDALRLVPLALYIARATHIARIWFVLPPNSEFASH